MKTEGCKYNKGMMCQNGICSLIEQLEHQAVFGGPEKPGEKGGAGPYFTKYAWSKLTNTIKEYSLDCPNSEKIRERIIEITEQKLIKGELY